MVTTENKHWVLLGFSFFLIENGPKKSFSAEVVCKDSGKENARVERGQCISERCMEGMILQAIGNATGEKLTISDVAYRGTVTFSEDGKAKTHQSATVSVKGADGEWHRVSAESEQSPYEALAKAIIDGVNKGQSK